MKGFSKEQRSTFKYWFAHWCSYNMTALVLHHWKPKYLFHDIEKPWLRLFLGYPRTQAWHRTHNRHHLEWWMTHGFDPVRMDWEAMVLDWECSRHTKQASPRTASEQLEVELEKLKGVLLPGRLYLFEEYTRKALRDLGL